jgi:GAF domain-containing protein
MLNFIKSLISPPVFADDEEKTRGAELLNVILNTLIVAIFLAIIAILLGRTSPPAVLTVVSLFFILLVLLKIPLRLGFIKQSSIAIVILLTSVLTLVLALGGTIRAPAVVFYILASVISGLLIGRRAIFWSVGINTLIFFGLLWAEISGRLPEPNITVNIQQGIVFAATSLLTAVLLNLALKRQYEALEHVRQSQGQLASANIELEQRVEARTSELAATTNQIKKRASQLEAIAYTARSAASAKSLDELLSAITRDVSARFGFYHVGIFLLDSNKEYALLKAANSDGGMKMLARGHRLHVGQQGLVGFVTSQGVARVAQDVGGYTAHLKNPDLPETNSEVALPLKLGSEIIGAMDIQSRELNAFSQEDLGVFSILADQVSIAIQNARSLEQVNQALREAEIASSRLTGQAWKGYIESTGSRGYRYDGTKPEPLTKKSLDADAKDALSIPVQLRGQTIGHLKLKGADSSHKWTEDELAIIQSTAERVALAADSARLLEEAQKRASRETLISEISAKLGASFQLDSILRDTVEELGSNLRNSTVTFQLVNPTLPPSSENSNGGSPRRKKSE